MSQVFHSRDEFPAESKCIYGPISIDRDTCRLLKTPGITLQIVPQIKGIPEKVLFSWRYLLIEGNKEPFDLTFWS